MGRPPKPPKKEPVFPPSTFAAPSREELLEDVQGAIVQALEARSEYVRQEATTVTLASLRRILEKDLNVETGFLETHKEFVTGLIKELLQGPEEQSPETGKVSDEHGKGKEKVIEEAESEVIQEDVPKPKMKRLKKKADSEGMKDEVIQMPLPVVNEDEVRRDTEARIWEAAHKRAAQFKAQAETLTVKIVRRILEEDLEFEEGGLDSYKDHVRAALDEILNSENPENAESPENEEPAHIAFCEEPVTEAKKGKAAAPEKKPGKKRKRASGEETEKSDSIEGEETPKIRKSKKSKKKVVQEEDEDASGGDGDGGEPNEKGHSSAEESDDVKPERKKVSKVTHQEEQSKQLVESKRVYSKKVEHLKNVIKDCGITVPLSVETKAKRTGVARRDNFLFLKVPPSVYKKAKQAGESRREGVMIAELEAILRKEGLTASASKDEIKAVRKRKEKLKDLEGIDTSNIIEEPRGRRSRASANSFFAPRRNDPVDLGDEDEEEEEDEDGDDNSEGDPNVELQDDDDDED